ncbi:uncharacterized protein LOC114294099 [Camellia sinensis]|uniref:uncharacterized protein LOC114294099 n=1 Tax=Camellia sinensis TaxID=4442 RepID=UPI0010361D87|nr:uncharacterized protein LOC114294099 [Camellia sinensis]
MCQIVAGKNLIHLNMVMPHWDGGLRDVCIGLGIKSSIVAGIDGSGFGHQRSLLTKFVFFMGLHETMLYWWRRVLTLVVDDTVFFDVGEVGGEGGSGFNFGSLWWWRLRDEVSHLVVVAVVKKEMAMGVGVAEFVGWRLYYVNVTIGMVRIVKGILGIS